MSRLPVALLVVLLAALALPAGAQAGRGLETVLQDDAQLLHQPDAEVRTNVALLKVLGVDRIRVTAGWSVLTQEPDAERQPAGFDATDPTDYDQARFASLDRLMRLASEAGLRTMVDLAFFAPRWASKDPVGERGRTRMDPYAYAQFAIAVARRYNGAFVPPGSPEGSAPLPEVDTFALWNEPNHPAFIRPQWVTQGGRSVPASPHAYRAMVAITQPLLKLVRPDATVLIGGTSVTGSYRSRIGGVPPLQFLRELACVDRRLRPLRRPECEGFTTVPGDGWAHHPYSMQTLPSARSPRSRPDDAPIAELPRLARLLDRLVARKRLGPGVRDLWLTEYGYESAPPSTISPFSATEQARFIAWGEDLASRVPRVKSYAQFLLRDLPPGSVRVGTSKRRPFGQWESGLLFADGSAKPAASAFRVGLHVEQRGRRLRLFLRLRLPPGRYPVQVEHHTPGARTWEPLLLGSSGETTVDADARDAVRRSARAPAAARTRYRVRWLEGGRWYTGTSQLPARG